MRVIGEIAIFRMSSAVNSPRHVTKPIEQRSNHPNSTEDAGTVLDLLGDEYTRGVLRAILAEPRSGNEVATVADMSKATAFRRLNALADAGLVSVSHRLDLEGGNHHKVYSCKISELSMKIDEDGFALSMQTRESESAHSPNPLPSD